MLYIKELICIGGYCAQLATATTKVVAEHRPVVRKVEASAGNCHSEVWRRWIQSIIELEDIMLQELREFDHLFLAKATEVLRFIDRPAIKLSVEMVIW
jgi:chemotaxis regulatin CheY-phosphate phosphatase CheZ